MVRIIIILLSIVTSLTLSSQSILVTVSDDYTQQASNLQGVDEFSFNDMSNGNYNNIVWDGVGSFDNMVVHQGSNVFGALSDTPTPWGTFNSQQMTVGNLISTNFGTPVTQTTLTLDEASSYFGFYWSAGDGDDLLQFYSGTDLVAEFTTQSVINHASLNWQYYGDPNHYQWGRRVNSREPYAFLNFFGDTSTSWDNIVFTQLGVGGSGFEVDNLTVRTNTFNSRIDDISTIGTALVEVSNTTTTVVNSPISTWSGFSDSNSDGDSESESSPDNYEIHGAVVGWQVEARTSLEFYFDEQLKDHGGYKPTYKVDEWTEIIDVSDKFDFVALKEY